MKSSTPFRPFRASETRKSFCVTAINRLTCQRETVSPPCSSSNASAVLSRVLATPPRNRSYIYPRIERFNTQTVINFKQ